MSIAQSLLAEFETQAPITRKFLERLPEDKLTWKPHEKSMPLGRLATLVATMPAWIDMVREVVTLDNADTGRVFGESLPAGLKLIGG